MPYEAWGRKISINVGVSLRGRDGYPTDQEHKVTMLTRLQNAISEKTKEPDVETTSKGSKEDIATGEIESLDEAEIFLRQHGVTNTQLEEMLADPEKSKRLCRRVDLILLPLLCGTYCLQFIDKQALSYSAVFDLFTDANISSDQYSWLASLFYFGTLHIPSSIWCELLTFTGYLFWEYPASHIAQRLPIGTVISSFVYVLPP